VFFFCVDNASPIPYPMDPICIFQDGAVRSGGFIDHLKKESELSSLTFKGVSFSYDGSTEGLFSALDFGVSVGWTGVLGRNGAGKTTLLQLACGELQPRQGAVHAPPSAVYCPQRTDAPMLRFGEFLEDTSGGAYRLRGRLGIEEEWQRRWDSLSHGERKRAQIGTALWLEPDLLAIDEPTNHLDRVASRMIREALGSYRGVGLLVSHDRGLLDALCRHVLMVEPPSVSLRSGGYSTATRALQAEEEEAAAERRRLQQEHRRLRREADVRRRHVDRAEKAKSLRGVAPRDHDARYKARVARISDGQTSKRLRQLDGRIRQMADKRDEIHLRRSGPMGVEFRGEVSTRNALFRLTEGEIALGAERILLHGDLIMLPRDRVAVVGPNGSGKTTLIERIVSRLLVPRERTAYIPQEITAGDSRDLLDEVQRMPADQRGRIMRCVSRLGSVPEQLLGSACPSPGETRKLLLALHLANCAQLIMMDEPTNHMDLPSIECLEEALRSYVGGLLLVSHDRRFVESLTSARWEIIPDDPQGKRQTVRCTIKRCERSEARTGGAEK